MWAVLAHGCDERLAIHKIASNFLPKTFETSFEYSNEMEKLGLSVRST